MSFIFDPAIISQELEKLIELDKETKLFYGVQPDGSEKTATYSLRDKWRIGRELERLYKKMRPKTPSETPEKKNFYLTSGGPGSGKTTMIRALQADNPALARAVHVDPDEIMKEFRPYRQLVKSLAGSDIGRAVAYTYWRGASNYLSSSIMNKLADDGHDIFFGTTGTSPSVKKIYDAAKQAGYRTTVLICHAPEEVRLAGAAERFKKERRYTPDADVKNKGNVMFPEIVSTHFAKADNVQVYWRRTMEDEPVLALETQDGKVVVRDAQARDEFVQEIKKHKPGLNWESVVAGYEARFHKPPAASPSRNGFHAK